LQWEFRADEREIGEPLKLAYLFSEKRTGQPVASIAYVSSKDVETAKQFLTEITFEEAPTFLDFALAEAAKTNFDVQTLGGLRQYLAGFKAGESRRAVVHQRKAAEQHREEDRLSYDAYRRKEVAAIFDSLPVIEREEIELLARQAAAGFGGSLAEAMFATKRSHVTAQRYGNRIASFEEWKTAA
jgi:hypothetical protein